MCIIILWYLVIIKTTESDSLSGKRKLTVHFMLSFFFIQGRGQNCQKGTEFVKR